MGIEPTEDASQRPPPVLKTGPRTSQGRATAAESSRFLQWGQSKSSCAYVRGWPQDRARIDSNGGGNAPNAASPHRDEVRRRVRGTPRRSAACPRSPASSQVVGNARAVSIGTRVPESAKPASR